MTVEERLERIESSLDKLTSIVFNITEATRRLERVAGVLLINDEELDRRLTVLEGRKAREVN